MCQSALGRESQRDSVPKPRVARNELPWVAWTPNITTPLGLKRRRGLVYNVPVNSALLVVCYG